MWASTLCPFSNSMRNIALGRGSTTRPSTSMAPSFLAILFGDPCFLRFRVFSCDAPVLGAALAPTTKRGPMGRYFRGTRRVGAEAAPLVYDTRFAARLQNCGDLRPARGCGDGGGNGGPELPSGFACGVTAEPRRPYGLVTEHN